MIIEDANRSGRRKVWFFINGLWVHKGWLMPGLGE